MLAMYGARSGGVSTAQAAREASLKQLRARRGAGQSTHPVYWGGFIAVGM